MQAFNLRPRAVREARLHLQRGLRLERDRLLPDLHRQIGRHRVRLHLQRCVAPLDRHLGAQLAAAHREGLGEPERRPEVPCQRRELNRGLATHRPGHHTFFLCCLQPAFGLSAYPWRSQIELSDCERLAVNPKIRHQRHIAGRRRLLALRSDRKLADSQAALDHPQLGTADCGGQRALQLAATDPCVAGHVLNQRRERCDIYINRFQRDAFRLLRLGALA